MPGDAGFWFLVVSAGFQFVLNLSFARSIYGLRRRVKELEDAR
jgi:hypothetical protein